MFETSNVYSSDVVYYFLLQNMLGRVEINHYDPLGFNKGLLKEKIYNQTKSVYSIESSTHHFSDTGILVIRAVTSSNGVNNAID